MKNAIDILKDVENGTLTAEEALLQLKAEPFVDMGFAKVDVHRKIRQGVPEVIYGEGKTAEQLTGIVDMMTGTDSLPVLVTRIDADKAAALEESVCGRFAFMYNEAARIAVIGDIPEPSGLGTILIATGGTSDIPVAEEAAVTAETLGNEVLRLYDVGVAGIHRLLANKEYIMNASVVIAVAGMEGALASVVGGLADCPVIAVPTSVGYGASFGGLSALLSMLNSCASGVAVVNIDNGFGAGFIASRINHMRSK